MTRAVFRTRWQVAVRDSDLSRRNSHVALVVSTWMDPDGLCWPSIHKIGVGARISERTAQRAVADLDDAGWLHREIGGGSGRVTRYKATLPPGVKGDTSDTVSNQKPRQQRQGKVTDEVGNGDTRLSPEVREVPKEGSADAFEDAPPPEWSGPPPWIAEGMSRQEWLKQQTDTAAITPEAEANMEPQEVHPGGD